MFFERSAPVFPASLLSPTTTDVVLSKENHTRQIEVTTLDRKSGEPTCPGLPWRDDKGESGYLSGGMFVVEESVKQVGFSPYLEIA
jgi:hypothetical protein